MLHSRQGNEARLLPSRFFAPSPVLQGHSSFHTGLRSIFGNLRAFCPLHLPLVFALAALALVRA